MSIFGQVIDGQIVLDDPKSLPNGVRVRIEPIESNSTDEGQTPTLLERLGDFVGSVQGLPADASRNVDHYLYGHPKQ